MGIRALVTAPRAALLVLATVGLTACGDDGATGVALENFSAQTVISSMNELAGLAQPASEATDQIFTVLDQLDVWEDGVPVASQLIAPARSGHAARLRAEAGRYVPLLPEVDFGAAAGKTYVFDTQAGEWVVDPNDSGNAPENGIRVTLYDLTTVGDIAGTIGYADLVDLDDDVAERMSITAVDTSGGGSRIILDVTQSLVVTETGTSTIEQGEADGVLGSGPTGLSFEISSTREIVGSGELRDVEEDFSMSFLGAGASYTWNVQTAEQGASGDYSESFQVSLVDGGVSTSLDLAVEGNVDSGIGDGTGSISQDGELVANIRLDNDYDFTTPAGEPYNNAAESRLQNTLLSLLLGGLALVEAVPVLFPTPFLI